MKSPHEIAKGHGESAQQQAFMAWCAMAASFGLMAASDPVSWSVKGHAQRISQANTGFWARVPELRWIHAIPNGGSRGDTKKSAMINGAIMAAEGVKKGVLDIFLPVSSFTCGQRYSGLYIEMKVGRNKLSPEQQEFKRFVEANDYAVAVCYSWEEAVSAVRKYLAM